jgi:hypothetical protein
MENSNNPNSTFKSFDRNFFESTEDFSVIGQGSMGGKAAGLAFIKNIIDEHIDKTKYPNIVISIPRLVVLNTGVFDKFMERNDLYDLANSDESDEKIATVFQDTSLPYGNTWRFACVDFKCAYSAGYSIL